ncbi:MAG: hypothetical protein ACOY0T_37770 [Myxococcota bacterium]
MRWFQPEPSPVRLYVDHQDVEGRGTLLYVDFGGEVETWFLRATAPNTESHPVRASDGLMLVRDDSERLRAMLRAQRAVVAAARRLPVRGRVARVALLSAATHWLREEQLMGAPVRPRPPKEDPSSNPDYLAHVRARGCCVAWAGGCSGQVVAHHHGKADGGGGVSRKPSDFYTVPLCDFHHREFHNRAAITNRSGRVLLEGMGLDLFFAREMVRCLVAWIGGEPTSKMMRRLEPSDGGEF